MSIRLDANPAHKIVLTVRHRAILSSDGPQVVQMLQKGLFLIFPFNLPLLPQTEYVF